MKLTGTLKGMSIYESPIMDNDIVYLVNPNNFYINYPKRKDRKPDMRFSVNKIARILRSV